MSLFPFYLFSYTYSICEINDQIMSLSKKTIQWEESTFDQYSGLLKTGEKVFFSVSATF